MRTASLLTALAAAASVQAGPAKQKRQAATTPVTAKGNAFFVGEDRFYVRGIAYQPGGSSANLDPLANPKICLKDLEKFEALGVNVVRVYSTDNTKDHKECMEAYAEAGIYVVLDANNPKYSINRETPGPSYNEVYLQSVFATVDEFAKYPNTMAFFSGNEVINHNTTSTLSARYVKAVTRDMRTYIRERGYRPMLVGYSAADVEENRMQTAEYFNCGTDDERSDFFAFNDYSWCTSDFKTSGWDKKVEKFKNYGVPIFLSEFGCIENTRDFGELEALMSDKMTHVYSGGLMFEYTMEENGYGIVTVAGAKTDQTGARSELPEFKNFASALSKYPAPTTARPYLTTSAAATACPTKDEHWLVESTLLPSIPEKALAFMKDGAGKGPGLDGPGSQWAGTPSKDDAAPGSGTGGGSSTSKSASSGPLLGSMDKAPFVISSIVFAFTFLGAVLL